MGVGLRQFIDQLTGSGLMSAAEVAAFQAGLSSERQPVDGETLAKALVHAGKLTKFQAASVYQGHIKGLVFGDYRVLDKIGQGGMGVVLKAKHCRMGRLVAVKRVSSVNMQSPQANQRFYREVQAAAKLSHPNIVAAYDAGEQDGGHYLVMEYVDGKSLAHLVKKGGPLPVEQAVDYAIQVARGMQYAHAQGIVHRDIKPGNLLLDPKGTIKILDMGLARVHGLGDEGGDRLTQDGQVLGTCDYIAPEQVSDTHNVDARADIYSLGCTLYRLVTGKPPYTADTPVNVLMAHCAAPIPSLAAARPGVAAELDAVCQKMMAKSPEDRQQSMAEVIADLEACKGRLIAGPPVLRDQPSQSSAPSTPAPSSFGQTFAISATTTAMQKQVAAPSCSNSSTSSGSASFLRIPSAVAGEETHQPHTEPVTSTSHSFTQRLVQVPARKEILIAAAVLVLTTVTSVIVLLVAMPVRHPESHAATVGGLQDTKANGGPQSNAIGGPAKLPADPQAQGHETPDASPDKSVAVDAHPGGKSAPSSPGGDAPPAAAK